MKNEYPGSLTTKEALKMLLASCERLQWHMGGSKASEGCTGLIDKWDRGDPTIFYLERNMEWARIVLDRESIHVWTVKNDPKE